MAETLKVKPVDTTKWAYLKRGFQDMIRLDDHPIDRNIAERTPCHDCGSKCEYIGYHNMSAYYAFAHCLTCDAAHEF